MTFDPLERYLNLRSAQYERRVNLRPMMGSQLMDVAMRAYRSLGLPLLEACAGPTLLGMAGLVFVQVVVLPDFFATSSPDSLQVQASEVIVAILLGLLVAVPLMMMGASYVTALTVHLISDYMVGNVPSMESARRAARLNFRKTFLMAVRQMLLASAGVILSVLIVLISAAINEASPESSSLLPAFAGAAALMSLWIGGLFMLAVLARDCLAIPAMLQEGLPFAAALKRGRELMKRQPGVESGYGHVASAVVLVCMVLAFLAAGMGSAYGLISGVFEEAIAGMPVLARETLAYVPIYIAMLLVLPMWGVCCTIIYYERRVRVEAYDVDALAQDVWRSQKGVRFHL